MSAPITLVDQNHTRPDFLFRSRVPALSWIGCRRTEELLAATGLLNNLNKTGLELLDGGNVAGEDTHLAGLCGNVHLDAVVCGVSTSAS